jgi:hypothetical protein
MEFDPRVAAGEKEAIFRGSPALFLNQVESAVDVLGSARLLTRRIWETLGELARDATGTTQFSDIYEDPDIRRVEKTLYNLDHAMGQGIDGVEFIGKALKKKLKFAGELDDPMSRHEEGKPADPTKDMSPEDAQEWKLNTLKHKDEFKSADWKTSKLQSRQEKILKKYLDSAGSRAVMDFDELPPDVQADLKKVKDQETLWSDVNRWLGDNNNPHLRTGW